MQYIHLVIARLHRSEGTVVRRYGLIKATVVDVARVLDVSHGSVYRRFASKAALHFFGSIQNARGSALLRSSPLRP